MAGTDVPPLHTLLEILSRNNLEYDSNDIDCYALSRMCYHIDGEVSSKVSPEFTPLDQSPRNHAAYL